MPRTVAALTAALAALPDDARLLAERSAAHAATGDWVASVDDARRAAEADPTSAEAHLRRG